MKEKVFSTKKKMKDSKLVILFLNLIIFIIISYFLFTENYSERTCKSYPDPLKEEIVKESEISYPCFEMKQIKFNKEEENIPEHLLNQSCESSIGHYLLNSDYLLSNQTITCNHHLKCLNKQKKTCLKQYPLRSLFSSSSSSNQIFNRKVNEWINRVPEESIGIFYLNCLSNSVWVQETDKHSICHPEKEYGKLSLYGIKAKYKPILFSTYLDYVNCYSFCKKQEFAKIYEIKFQSCFIKKLDLGYSTTVLDTIEYSCGTNCTSLESLEKQKEVLSYLKEIYCLPTAFPFFSPGFSYDVLDQQFFITLNYAIKILLFTIISSLSLLNLFSRIMEKEPLSSDKTLKKNE